MSPRITVAIAAALAAFAGAPAAAAAWPACVPARTTGETGVREVARQADGRQLTLTLRSRGMGRDERVSVLLPVGYDRSERRYAVLYLLHGAFGSERAWLDEGAAEAATRGLPLIVVMPNGGSDGGYSDWVATAPGFAGPAPAWETFHMRELVPFVDRTLRTIAGPGGRAVAGLSMGGHGALKYAAAYPGTFGFAGSFSGAVHPGLPLYLELIQECKYGDPSADRLALDENDPTALAANLRGTRLLIRTGDGTPGPLDPPGTPELDPVEAVVSRMHDVFLAALGRAGVAADVRRGRGTHSWPYWRRDLRDFLTWLTPQLGEPFAAPARFTMRSAKPSFTAWGWRFAVRRAAPEPLVLRDVGPGGLRATGRGVLRVATAPGLFAPGSRHRVAGRPATATRAGRLRFVVDLGPRARTAVVRIR